MDSRYTEIVMMFMYIKCESVNQPSCSFSLVQCHSCILIRKNKWKPTRPWLDHHWWHQHFPSPHRLSLQWHTIHTENNKNNISCRTDGGFKNNQQTRAPSCLGPLHAALLMCVMLSWSIKWTHLTTARLQPLLGSGKIKIDWLPVFTFAFLKTYLHIWVCFWKSCFASKSLSDKVWYLLWNWYNIWNPPKNKSLLLHAQYKLLKSKGGYLLIQTQRVLNLNISGQNAQVSASTCSGNQR